MLSKQDALIAGLGALLVVCAASQSVTEAPTSTTPSTASVAAQIASLTSAIDTAYILFCAVLVLFMQAGFAMLEAGIVTRDSSKNILFNNLMDSFVGMLVYYLVGFAFSYGIDPNSSNGFIGNNYFAFKNMPGSAANWIKWLYAYSFAATATTIVSGATAERIRVAGYMVWVAVAHAFVYPIISHWMWSNNGWLSPYNLDRSSYPAPFASLGAIDFAGDASVHLAGAVPSLIGAWILGYRGQYTKDQEKYPPRFYRDANKKWQVNDYPANNDITATLGVMILWIGWYGFNCGSTGAIVGYEEIAARVAVTTSLSAASGGVFAIFLGLLMDRTTSFNLGDGLNGILAGLVSITGPCAVVEPYAAIIIGIIGGGAYKVVCLTMSKLRIDDPVDAVAVHGGAGGWGLIASGFFATKAYVAQVYKRPADVDDWGVFYGGSGRQLGVQLLAFVVVVAWCASMGLLVFGTFWLIDRKRTRPLFIFKDEGTFERLTFGSGDNGDKNAGSGFVQPDFAHMGLKTPNAKHRGSVLYRQNQAGTDVSLHSIEMRESPTHTTHEPNTVHSGSSGSKPASPVVIAKTSASSSDSDSDSD
eukprot:TRINITY_DN2039_c0_g1_i1.p1 TRINITY_DN2039_c0_g1~~TRINITY_DN2039_c0_g1_i1.p1  ORF type:complete len:587 (+),score=167.39 TRINITY_DN2039_c0_g1_i1:110-1870(+)